MPQYKLHRLGVYYPRDSPTRSIQNKNLVDEAEVSYFFLALSFAKLGYF